MALGARPTERERSGRRALSKISPDAKVAVGLGILAGLITLFATWKTPIASPDSGVYLSAGSSLSAGHGLRDFSGHLVTLFPPGLPVLVAAGHLVGFAATSWLRAVNALSFGLTVWFGFILLRRHVGHRSLVLAATCFVAVSEALASNTIVMLSEPVFIAVSLGLLITLEKAQESRWSMPWMAAVVALVWAGFSIRYSGVLLIVLVPIAIMMDREHLDRRSRFVLAGSALVASSFAPAAWVVRNHLADGTLLGPRSSTSTTIGVTLHELVSTLGIWLLPVPAVAWLQLTAVGLLVVALCGALLIVHREARSPRSTMSPAGLDATERSSRLPAPSARLLVVFVVLSVVYLVIAEITTPLDQIGNRLLTPVFVPIVICVAMVVDRVLEPRADGRPPSSRVARAAVALVVIVLLGDQAVATAREVRTTHDSNARYADETAHPTGIFKAVSELPNRATVFTDNLAGLWLRTGRTPLLPSPIRERYQTSERLPIRESIIRGAAWGHRYLAWFSNPMVATGFYTPEQLAAVVDLRVLSSSPDGELFEISPKGASASGCAQQR